MELSYIYLFIGFSTLALNLMLTTHLIKKHKSTNWKEDLNNEEVITFRLTRDNCAYGGTTAAVSYEDTMPIE